MMRGPQIHVLSPMIHTWAMLSQPVWRILRPDGGRVVDGQRFLFAVALGRLEPGGVGLLRGGHQPRGRGAVGQRRAGGLGGVAALGRAKWLAYFSAPVLPMLGVALAVLPILVLGLLMKNRFLRLFGRSDLAAGAGRRVRDDHPPGRRAAGMAADVGHHQRRGDRQLRRLESHLLLCLPAAAPLSFLCDRGCGDRLAGLDRGGDLRRVGHLVGFLGRQLGRGSARMHELTAGSGESSLAHAATSIIAFWGGWVKLLAIGYSFSYFGVASTAIYYLLRRDVNARETDEVFLDADTSEEKFGLPTLQKDAAAAPEIAGNAAAADAGSADGKAAEGRRQRRKSVEPRRLQRRFRFLHPFLSHRPGPRLPSPI